MKQSQEPLNSLKIFEIIYLSILNKPFWRDMQNYPDYSTLQIAGNLSIQAFFSRPLFNPFFKPVLLAPVLDVRHMYIDFRGYFPIIRASIIHLSCDFFTFGIDRIITVSSHPRVHARFCYIK